MVVAGRQGGVLAGASGASGCWRVPDSIDIFISLAVCIQMCTQLAVNVFSMARLPCLPWRVTGIIKEYREERRDQRQKVVTKYSARYKLAKTNASSYSNPSNNLLKESFND